MKVLGKIEIGDDLQGGSTGHGRPQVQATGGC